MSNTPITATAPEPVTTLTMVVPNSILDEDGMPRRPIGRGDTYFLGIEAGVSPGALELGATPEEWAPLPSRTPFRILTVPSAGIRTGTYTPADALEVLQGLLEDGYDINEIEWEG